MKRRRAAQGFTPTDWTACKCCGVEVVGEPVYLYLDRRITDYTDREPPEMFNQGGFPFGPVCARRAVKRSLAKLVEAGHVLALEADLDILSYVVADSVVREVAYFLQTDDLFGKGYEDCLSVHADGCYLRLDGQFRKIMRSKRDGGNYARDYLYSFMRHWLASYLKRDHPDLHRRLPGSFGVGISLAGKQAA